MTVRGTVLAACPALLLSPPSRCLLGLPRFGAGWVKAVQSTPRAVMPVASPALTPAERRTPSAEESGGGQTGSRPSRWAACPSSCLGVGPCGPVKYFTGATAWVPCGTAGRLGRYQAIPPLPRG